MNFLIKSILIFFVLGPSILFTVIMLKIVVAIFLLAVSLWINYSDALSCLPCNKVKCKKAVSCKGMFNDFFLTETQRKYYNKATSYIFCINRSI